MGKSILTRMNFAWSACHDLLSTSITLPSLLLISRPASSVMYSNGKPQIWIQNGAWVKTKLAEDKPFLHRHRSRRLFSKFHGPLRSTHSNWNIELNLNCKTLLPTSTIRRSEPFSKLILECSLGLFGFDYDLPIISQTSSEHIPLAGPVNYLRRWRYPPLLL